MKFSGGYTKSHTHQANFGADPDHDLDRGIFNRITTTQDGPIYEFCGIRVFGGGLRSPNAFV